MAIEREEERGIKQHAVNGEVTALHVFCRAEGEPDLVGAAPVKVNAIMAKGGDFCGDACAFIDVLKDEDDAEVCAYLDGVLEELRDLCGGGAGGYVKVFGVAVKQKVTDAAAGEVSRVACGAELSADGAGGCECGGVFEEP